LASAITRARSTISKRAYVANSQQLVWLKVDPTFDPLRAEPRFVALMQRLNFIP
jgi:hypothetical protein